MKDTLRETSPIRAVGQRSENDRDNIQKRIKANDVECDSSFAFGLKRNYVYLCYRRQGRILAHEAS
jgi:hypothetical protein